MKNVSVIGEGAWGTALASLLADNGYQVTLWCHDHDVAQQIRDTRKNNKYAPNFNLNKNIIPTTELREAFVNTIIFFAIPVRYTRDILKQCASYYNQEQIWVMVNKGIEQETLLVPTQILNQVFNTQVNSVALAGPSFAHDLMNKQPTGVVLSSLDNNLILEIKKLVENSYFFTQESRDILGVQLAAALKNIFALGMGILEGAGYGTNTQALFLTKSLEEIKKLILANKSSVETVYGLAGVGDLLLTCFGKQSRNRQFGMLIGQQKSIEEATKFFATAPEGLNTLKSIQELAKKLSCQLPICSAIYHIIFESQKPESIVKVLKNIYF